MSAIYEARRRLLPQLRRLPEPVEARARRLMHAGRPNEGRLYTERPNEARPYSEPVAPPAAPPCAVRPDGVVVLLYHRIAEDHNDPFLLSVSPQRFEEHMAIVKRYAEPVTLAGVLQRKRHPRVAVTFDDGYADNVQPGGAILQAASVPATVFVTSGSIGSDKPLWPLRLEELFRLGEARADRLDLEIGGTAFSIHTPRGTNSAEALMAAHDLLTPRHPMVIAEAMSQLEDHFGGDVATVGRRMLSGQEVQAMANSDIFTIGAHTRSHAWLSALGRVELEDEIAGSRRDLEGLTGRPVTEFAYPFGTRISFDRAAANAVRRAGFSLACTTFDDPHAPGTSRYLLPRRPVYDWDGPRFEAMLSSWLAA